MVKFLCWTKRVGHREAFVVFGAKEAILLPQREVINWLNYFYVLVYVTFYGLSGDPSFTQIIILTYLR